MISIVLQNITDRIFFSIKGSGWIGSSHERNETWPLCHTVHKIYFLFTVDLKNMKVIILKLLKYSKKKYLYKCGVGKEDIQKPLNLRENSRLDNIRIKEFCLWGGPIKEVEKKICWEENICNKYIQEGAMSVWKRQTT